MQCELCQQETTNIAEKRTGASYNPTTQQQTPIEYTMPVYCDACLSDILSAEDEESVLVLCPYCQGHHYKGGEKYCPRNPNKK